MIGHFNITFSEFLQKLYPFCSAQSNTPEFLYELLRHAVNITSDDAAGKKNDPLDLDESSLRKIYNGNRPLPQKTANHILQNLDRTAFDSYLFELLSDDALTELCKEFEPYIGLATKENITTKLTDLFVQILKVLSQKTKQKIDRDYSNDVNNFDVEKALADIVDNLSNISPEQIDVLLRYDPLNVDKKILPQNALLKKDIRDDVINYYSYIKKLFQAASERNTVLFDRLAEQIKYVSDRYIAQGLPQQQVIDRMTEWLNRKSMSSNMTACRIMVSFFVQNCEVFHEITE